jgi:hypothetical protein
VVKFLIDFGQTITLTESTRTHPGQVEGNAESNCSLTRRWKSAKRAIRTICTKKVRAGQIREFTGMDAPYEAPEDPEIVVHMDKQTVDESGPTRLEQLSPFFRDYGAND